MSKGRNTHKGMPSQRQLRVGESLKKELSEILSRASLDHPDLKRAIITVLEVRMSPDLKVANVLIMPLGGQNANKIAEALNHCSRFLRGQVSKRITTKFTPELRFTLDTRFDDDQRIDQLIRSSHNQAQKREPFVHNDID